MILKSATITQGPTRAGARSMLKAIGFTDEDLAKPNIGIANTWIETMPCNYRLRELAEVVKEVAKVPVWAKLTPSTTDIVEEADAAFRGGADAIVSSNTFPSLPLIDPETLDFEMNVDGLVSSGGLGGPAILPQSLAKMSQLTNAFPDRAFSGIGGVSTFAHALNYLLLGCGTVQVCTAAMLDHAVGPNVIKALVSGMREFMEKRGFARLEDFRGIRRDRVVSHSQIRRPEDSDYQGGYEAEGYAEPAAPGASAAPVRGR